MISEEQDLTGKVAIVTGGSKGIGKEIALKLLSSGSKVSICARTLSDIDKLVSEYGNNGQLIGFEVDVTSTRFVKLMIEETEKKFGPVDILINNAGIGSAGKYWEMEFESIWKTIEVNLKGPMLFSYYILPAMIKNKKGLIVNIGSYAGIRPIPSAIPYSISKAGLVRLSDSLAELVSEYNINVFTVSPGLVLTDMTKEVEAFKNLPADQWSPIEKIAKLILRLTKNDVNSLNGRFFHVNDDIELIIKRKEEIKDKNLFTLTLNNFQGVVK